MACAKAVMRNGIRNIILSGTINFHIDNIHKTRNRERRKNMLDGKLKYVDAKGYFVGRFSETDLANGIDKTAANYSRLKSRA